MQQSVATQLKLRRAFRYGYFLFLAIFLILFGAFGVSIVKGTALSLVEQLLPDNSLASMVALALGLCVPVFFGCWSLVSKAMLGADMRQRSLLEGIGA